MLKLSRMGVAISPPVPAFYHRPQTIEEIVDQTRHRRYYGTTTSPFAPEAGELLVRESIALLGELG